MSEDTNTPEVQQVPFVRMQDFRIVFANHLRMRVTPSEFTLFFGLIDEIQQNTLVAVESVGVIMTPSVIKSLAEVLTQTISVYEEQHGEIKPPSTQPLNLEKMADIIRRQKEKITPSQP